VRRDIQYEPPPRACPFRLSVNTGIPDKEGDSPDHTPETTQLHLGIVNSKIGHAVCVRLNIPQIADVPHGTVWSAVKLASWVVMGARGRASFSYIAVCAGGRVSRCCVRDRGSENERGEGTN